MKHPVILMLAGMAILADNAAAASRPGTAVPDWLLGNWVVTKIYEDETKIYPDPGAEPKILYEGQMLMVEPNRISLIGQICTDVKVKKKKATIIHLLSEIVTDDPKSIGLRPRPGQVPYFDVTCGRAFYQLKDELVERDRGTPYWFIIRDGLDKIEMPFLAGAYLELRKKAP